MLILEKIKGKIWSYILYFSYDKYFYKWIYIGYWNQKFFSSPLQDKSNLFLTIVPNRGAGIGHQLANWNAGYWYSRYFDVNFAHSPFSSEKWDRYLGFWECEINARDLIKQGYKKVTLPLFNENSDKDINLVRKIINSYSGKKVIFYLEQDQPYTQQFGVMKDIGKKFNSSVMRVEDKSIYSILNFNIAVHVRRVVIIDGKKIIEDKSAQDLRWLENDYYHKVLSQLLKESISTKPVAIYIFSTGSADEFLEFKKYGEVHFCTEMNEYETFLHLIKADLLVTSKSSFSYKAGLISSGIKISPRNFWHHYPDQSDWILAENDGMIDEKKLKLKL